MQAAAAVTASAVSAKGSKWMRLMNFLAFVESEKNLSWRSSSDVLESFLSSVTCRMWIVDWSTIDNSHDVESEEGRHEVVSTDT